MRIIDAKAEIIGGVIDAAAELSGQVIEANAELVNEIRATTYPDYTGEYNVTPTEEAQTLNTAETVLMENVTVDAVPEDYVGSGITRRTGLSVSGLTVTAGAGYYEEAVSETVTPNLQSASASYTPTESAQTDTIVADLYHDGLSSVGITVGAVPSDYVGSDVPRRDALSVSGATVSGAAGYYDEAVSAAVASGSAKTPATSITANPTISVGNDGKITASVSKTQSVTPTVQEGYVSSGTAGNVTVSGTKTEQLSTQAGTTITPSTSEQTAVAAGKFTTGDVKVAAVPAGTEGTPVATKDAVSNHAIIVRPSVTNTAGYIEGGSHVGAGVSVSASELVSGTKSISANGSNIDVVNYAKVNVSVTPSLQTKSATPTESAQTITPDAGYYGLDEVDVAAISPNYVGSGVTRNDSTDLTASGDTVTAPAGYYEEAATKSVASGSAATPATTISVTPSITVDNDGLITSSVSASESVTPTVSAGYVSAGTAGTVTVSGGRTFQITRQPGLTVTPTTSVQTAVVAGRFTTGDIKVAAMPSGTEGTPTATKGTVSSHSVTVTPSVTNSAGYISGGTHTGTGVTVSASELVSGTKSITANGTGIDVTDFAAVDVSVSGGSDHLTKLATKSLGAISTSSTTDTDTGQTIEVTGFDEYDGIVCVCHVATRTNNRHVCTVRVFLFAATSNVNTVTAATAATLTQNYKLSSSGTLSARAGTTPYGVYAKAATLSTGTPRKLTFTIYQRYNSTSTGTINGSYVMDVYGLKLLDLF